PIPSAAGPYVAEAARWLPRLVQADGAPTERLEGRETSGPAGRGQSDDPPPRPPPPDGEGEQSVSFSPSPLRGGGRGEGLADDQDGRPRVLVADDNADMRQYLGRLLRETYDVEEVADGKAAIAATRGALPDLVLADVMMPELDGFDLLRELRADPRTRTAPVG